MVLLESEKRILGSNLDFVNNLYYISSSSSSIFYVSAINYTNEAIFFILFNP